MSDKIVLNEDVLNRISGGVLYTGWEKDVDDMIGRWKSYDDDVLIAKGFRPGKAGLIQFYRNNVEVERINEEQQKDFETLISYIEANY